MTDQEMSVLDCSPIFEKLKEYKACPPPLVEVWAHDNWQDPEAVASYISMLAGLKGSRPGKGKAVVCAVLGAALTAAQKDKHVKKQLEREMTESPQDLVKALQEQLVEERKQIEALKSQLADERNITHRFHMALINALDRGKISCLAKSAARPLYPTKDLEISREIYYPEIEGANLRPLIKTETTEGQGGRAPQVTTRTTPYPATELAKIQEKYTRRAHETETEYVWRVSLTGGDRILLSEDEAQGYWGPGVFLVTDDQREPWSLTQRAAFWAGSLDPLERGDPVCIETPTINHLTESLQKAACLQLMHDRRLVPQQPSPMLLIANPDQMTPLIRGLPDSLKSYAVQLQDRLRTALTPRRGRQGVGEPMTWGEIAQDLINYGRRMGLTRGMGKPKPLVRRVEQQENPPLSPPQVLRAKRNLLWTEGTRQGIPRELMNGLPTTVLEKLIQAWKDKRKLPPPSKQNIQAKGGAELKTNEMVAIASQTPTAPEEDLINLGSGNWTCHPQ
uniref:Uncharacterized protein n=1 Tax=Athene cunicularia TaxID=194338 RepID=A0A663LLW3_ATHCN